MVTVFWRGQCAYLYWRANGQRHRCSIGTLTPREAEVARATKQYELSTGIRVTPASGVPLFRDYAEEYLHWFVDEYPASAYFVSWAVRNRLVPQFGMLAIDGIGSREVDAWKAELRKPRREGGKTIPGLKADSVNKYLRILKAMLNRAVEWKLITLSPAGSVKAVRNLDSRPPPFYMPAELTKLYKAGDALSPVWRLMANTGMRRAEALNLRRVNVKADRILILSSEASRTKSAKWREVPKNKAAAEALEALSGADYVLPRMVGTVLTRHYASDVRQAEIGGTLHWLRHTFASHMVMGGASMREVKELLGHSSTAVTEKYAHLAPGYSKNKVMALNL